MLKTYISTACAVCFLGFPGTLSAQSAGGFSDTFSKKDAAKLAVSVGASTAKLWMESSDVKIPESALPPEQRRAFMEDALTKYTAIRSEYHQLQRSAETLKILTDVNVGVISVMAPPLALPATLVDTAVNASIDIANQEIERTGRRRGAAYLDSIKIRLLEDLELPDYAALRANSERVRGHLKGNGEYLKDLRDRATDDELEDFAIDVTVRALQQNDENLLEALVEESKRIDGVASDLDTLETRFEDMASLIWDELEDVNDRLDTHTDAIGELQEKTEALTTAVLETNERIDNLAVQHDFVADFAMSRMTPEEKLNALRHGFMADRFRCPDGGSKCDAALAKNVLINEAMAQKDFQNSIETAQSITAGIADVQTILTNLDLPVPEEVGKALQIGSAAANAFVSFSSANVLGGIAAISSVFGKKKDPDAERFKIMMRFLQKQFSIVNQKLNALIDGQKVILESLSSLAQSLDKRLDRIDAELDVAKFERRLILDSLRALLSARWDHCVVVHEAALTTEAMDGTKVLIDGTLRVRSFDHLVALIAKTNIDARECLNEPMSAVRAFGRAGQIPAFVNAKHFADENSTIFREIEDGSNQELKDARSELQRYYEDVFLSVRSLTNVWAASKGVSSASLISVLTIPMRTVESSTEMLSYVEETPFGCGTPEAQYGPLDEMLCPTGTVRLDRASRLLDTPLLSESVLSLADWTLVVAQLADAYDGADQTFALTIERLLNIAGPPRGRELTKRMTEILSATIASYSMTFGPVGVRAIETGLAEGADGTRLRAATALESNRSLGRNFAMLHLHDRLAKHFQPSSTGVNVKRLAYAQAIKEAIDTGGIVGLTNMFGTDIAIRATAGQMPRLAIPAPAPKNEVVLDFPGITAFDEGRLVYPALFEEMVMVRDRFADCLADYALTDDLTSENAGELMELIVQ